MIGQNSVNYDMKSFYQKDSRSPKNENTEISRTAKQNNNINEMSQLGFGEFL